MMRLACSCAALAFACVAQAADDLQPAVNTSAPQSMAAPQRAATNPAAAAPAAATATSAVPTTRPTVVAPRAGASGAASSSGSPSGGSARDRVELENTQITGNRELPKVMYVVPWKKPDLGDFGGRPARSLLDELLEPVDRDVFKRQNRYFEALQPDAPAPRSGDEK
jgi:hypothetical protein